MTDLLQAACEARKLAYVPYSHFPVGAAVLTDSGQVYAGCNIENASYGLTVCAERTAIFKAITAGEKRIIALAVVADTAGPIAPCGACRQVMAEFHIETVTMANVGGESRTVKFSELLPYAFSSDDMGS
jgi:cytidine deaminase